MSFVSSKALMIKAYKHTYIYIYKYTYKYKYEYNELDAYGGSPHLVSG